MGLEGTNKPSYDSNALCLGSSWVVVSGVMGNYTYNPCNVRGLITPVLTTHEPPSNDPHPNSAIYDIPSHP